MSNNDFSKNVNTTNDDIEGKTDEILTAIGKELLEGRKAYYDSLETDNPMPFFAPKEDRKKYKSRRVVRRSLLLVAILVLVFAIMVVASSGIREKIFHATQQDNGNGYTDVQGYDAGDMPVFVPSYVPEGYELVKEAQEGPYYNMTYADAEDEYIIFEQCLADEFSFTVDNDVYTKEETYVEDIQAYLYYDKGDNNMANILLWEYDGISMKLITYLDNDEVIEIAKSMKRK